MNASFSRWYVERKNSVEKFWKHKEIMQKVESFFAEQIVIDSDILPMIK